MKCNEVATFCNFMSVTYITCAVERVCPPPNPYVEALIPNMVVFGGVAFGVN